MSRVKVFDTTLRDGEQSPGASMTPAEKLRMAHQLDALGVDVIEAGFPVSSPDDFHAVQAIAREIRRPVIAAMARATPDDIRVAAAALEGAERSRIHVVLGTSDIHLEHKLRITRTQCLERAVAAVGLAKGLVNEVEFCAEDASRTELPFLCRVVETAIAAGAHVINVPDTVGYAHPRQIRVMVETLMSVVQGIDDVVLSVHCHNDLGFAVANSIAGIEAGARQVECTVNGIGERAGNAALEEIAMVLRVRSDAFPYETGIRTEEIYRASQLLTELTGIAPQPNKAVVGSNAFAHEAGIHQDGLLKHRSVYEIMHPMLVGVNDCRLVLGKHSGRRALEHRYRQLGYSLSTAQLDCTYRLFKEIADRRKTIHDTDLASILAAVGEGRQIAP
ncbi:MAG: 2-isopropylmalate synthase [Longimicrobiales bacterium]